MDSFCVKEMLPIITIETSSYTGKSQLSSIVVVKRFCSDLEALLVLLQ